MVNDMKEVYKLLNKLSSLIIMLVLILICFLSCSFNVYADNGVYEFEYTGDYQTFIVPRSGIYKLEVYGAQGGDRGGSAVGGKGGYTSGNVYLNKGDVLYVYVGGNGNTHNGYNGGGALSTFKIYGGGATDIRFVGGEWNNGEGLKSRLIVAGGGGSVGGASCAGGAGGLTGGTSSCHGSNGGGGTLSAKGSSNTAAGFGYGGNGTFFQKESRTGGAGGGGWYGGGGAYPLYGDDKNKGGGGGSSFTWNSQTKVYVPSGYSVSENYYLSDVSYTTGVNSDDGYAKITFIQYGDVITNFEINKGNIEIPYQYDIYEYNLTVTNDIENIKFNISVEDGYILTQSNQNTDMTNQLSVTNTITITDEETGIIQVYTVTVKKQNAYLESNTDTVSYGYSYTGNYEKFYVPATGIYTLETWGAQGGDRGGSAVGGKGGYAKAEMYLVKGEVLYIYVGGSGNTLSQDGTTKGWNGGGHTATYYSTAGILLNTAYYGGGASDIRYGGNTLYNRVLVAGGGGSVGGASSAGGAAGVGTSGTGNGGTAGAINAPGSYRASFGQGGNGALNNYHVSGGAGGGGWYGGGGANQTGYISSDDARGGGGGSNFAFTSGNSSYVPEGYLVTDKNYLENATLYNGNVSFTSPEGTTETGHSGDGYVRISPKLLDGVSEVSINDGEISIDFDYEIYEYNITILDSVDKIKVNFQLNDDFSITESCTGNCDISNVKQYTYTATIMNDITGVSTTYTINFQKQSKYLISGSTTSYGYSYTGSYQMFVAPTIGLYTLETWGAQGGGTSSGKGGYSTGQIFLNKGQILYVYVGASGTNGGYNGGGKAVTTSNGTLYGGGASDIRIDGQTLYNRLIVAGGGGSSAIGSGSVSAGVGGGITGGTGYNKENYGGSGGTQTSSGHNNYKQTTNSNGTFGQGGNGDGSSKYSVGGAGGGGWYGGGGGNGGWYGGGGGGSGFVWTSDNASIVPEDYLVSSDYYLTNASTSAGNTSFPSITGGTETGHSGDGYVKITFSFSYDYEITVSDNVTVDKEFDYETKEYTGTLNSNDSSLVTFTVSENEFISEVSGDGAQEIHVGDNDFNILITYVNGETEIFTYHIYREANDIDYLNNIYLDEYSISEFSSIEFNKDTLTYNIDLPYYMVEYDLTVDKGSSDQIITNIGHIVNKNSKYQILISVTNETGTSTRVYTLNMNLPHSSKIKGLTFNSSGGSTLEIPIENNVTEYDINIESYIASVTADVELYDSEAIATVTGDGYIENDEFIVFIEVTEPNCETTYYTFTMHRITYSDYEKNISYVGNVQTVVIPYDHEYLLEVWGAQGGNSGGRGGYSYGTIYLKKGTVLYTYAGGSGKSGGFNGGGSSSSGIGGGASDIRIGTDSLYSRVIVAGGGGGHGTDGCASGGVGGGLSGGGSASSGHCGTQAGAGTQTAAGTGGKYSSHTGKTGSFGIGASIASSSSVYKGGGGGGGWYGGGSGSSGGWSNGGGGGSGFIYTEETASTIENDSNWLLNSDYYLTDAATLSGSKSFTSPSGSNETGHSGNGAVKISIPYQESENNFLDGIISNKGVISPSWDYNVDTYYLKLNSEDTHINLEAVPSDSKASVTGNGDYIIEAGTTEINFVVTAENGYTKTYTLVVTRDADSNSVPKEILINGLIEDYCATLDGACVYKFDANTHSYNVTVPYTIREIVMVVDKGHYFQDTNGDGIYSLDGGNNKFQVDVISEDKTSTSTYEYNIYRDMTGNADLKLLKMTDPKYEINYSYNVTEYYVNVPTETETVEIEAIADDENATVKITKPETLDYGQNVITISVTAANGNKKTYYIYVKRLESNNAFLKDLTINDITDADNPTELKLDSEFNKMNLEYKLTVDNSVTKISLTGELEDSELATATGLEEYELNVGANTINVVVTAQDGSSLTYKFIVTRKANANTMLSELYVDESEFTENFESDKYTYYIYATGEVEELTIHAIPEAETSTYQIIGNYTNLIAGKNEVVVRVTAEDKTTCDYKIIVNRAGYTDYYLQSLTVRYGSENYILSPSFDPLYDEYTLELPNDITEVTLMATADGNKRAKIGNSSVYVKNINLLTENPSDNIITVTAENGEVKTYSLVITREKSSDNSLSSLTVEDNSLLPEFSSDTLEYSFTTNDHSLNISATPNNQFATVKISDNISNLEVGENIITITVTSETEEERIYTLTVTRELSTDNSLKSLEIKDITLDPTFDSNVLEYSFSTFNKTISITAIPNNKYATVEIEGSTSLNIGSNEIKIKVTSETGDERIYIINANRVLDSNNYLSNLTSNLGFNEEFDKEKSEYTATTEDTKISISPVLESSKASYSISDNNGNTITSFPTSLVLGENIFFINVTAQDGTVRTYKITVTRNKSSNSKLSSLNTSIELNEEFLSDIYQYTISTVLHELDITPIVDNELATYKITDSDGNILSNKVELATGVNTYIIIVTAEDETTSTYNLVVTRSNNNVATIDSLGFDVEPIFDKNTFEYTVSTDETSLNLDNLVLTDSYATYQVEGNSDFVGGEETTVTITVTAEDNTTVNTYTFKVTKEISTDSRISEFRLGDYTFTPVFDKDIYSYEVFIPSNLDTLNLEIKTLKNVSTIKSIMVDNSEQITSSSNEFNNNISIPNIKDNSSVITVIVTAEDGSESTYTLTLTDEDVINNYLSTLNVSCGDIDPNFDRDINSYTVFTNKEVTTCNVLATTEVDNATIVGVGDYEFDINEKYLIIPIKVTSERGEEKTYTVTIRRPYSSESRIKELSFKDGYTLDSVFSSDTYEYSVVVPNSVSILTKDYFTYTTVDPDSVVTFEDVKLTSGGVTKYIITSTSEDSSNTSTYILNVTREKSSDTTVSKVTSIVNNEEYSCVMDLETKTCELHLPSDTTKFTLNATIPEGAIVSPTNNSSYTLLSSEYEKNIDLTVTSEDGSVSTTYTVKVIRDYSSNNDLLNLQVNYTSLSNFSSSILNYDTKVIGTINQVMISATLADTKATIVTDLSNPFNLEYGENTIEVVVQAENKEEKTYIINITRLSGTDATLSKLEVKGYEFEEDFDSDDSEYTVRVPRTKSTLTKSEIIYELSDSDASISLDNKLEIDFNKSSNIYTIVVTASDGNVQKYYHISVLPELSTNNKVTNIVVDGNELTPNENNEFNYDIFDTDTTATLTSITLENEYAMHNIEFPQTITYNTPYQFIVTAENGDVATYTINLVRSKTRELKLSNIEVNFKDSDDCSDICTLDKVFDEDETNYEIYIPNKLTSLEDIVVTTKNNLQTYEIIGNSDFEVGENTVTIRVKNSINEVFDYTLTVYREANSDANLFGISFITPEYKITDFRENLYEYNVEFSELESGKYELEFNKKNSNQTVTVSGDRVLYFGRNNIVVHVKSESCTADVKTRAGCNEKEYIIHAYRYETYSNLLSSLTISSGDIGDLLQVFNKYTFDYVLEVETETSLIKVEGTAADSTHATVSGNGEYTLKHGLNTINVVVTPESGDSATYTLNIIRKKEDNVNLENLSVTGYTLSPTFAKNVVDYYIDIDSNVNSLDIKYVKEEEEQLVYIAGNSNFVTGENIVNVIVLSKDKSRAKTYHIHANRAPNDNNILNGITVTSTKNNIETVHELSPTFKSDVTEYTVNVSKDIQEVSIGVDKGYIMQSVVGSGNYILEYGTNVIPIAVTSESGIVNTYQVTINREYEFGLNDLTVSHNDTIYELTPEYSDGIYEYQLTVPYETDSVNVNATLKETLNDIDGLGDYKLSTGSNQITITVSYKEEESVDYIINIYREKCSDNTLESLQVAEGVIDPIFDPSILEYSVDIPYEYDTATIIYETTSDIATVEILNNTDLEIGITKDISVVVTAENGDKKTYVIHATRQAKPAASNRLIDMYVNEADLDPKFDISIMNYAIDVSEDTKKISLHVKAEEPTYTTVEVYRLGTSTKTAIDVTVKDPKVLLNVETGKNVFIIRVTNYEGSVRNYQLTVYKTGTNEARIKNLSFDYGTLTPAFDKNKNAYTMEVSNSITSITEEVTMMDSNATYTITGNKNLSPGENIVTITTLAQDGKTSLEYTIIVTKTLSSNAYLSNIETYPEKDFTFDKDKYNYVYHVPSDTNSIQIIGIREDLSSKITGNGIYSLTGENTTIKLTVVAEDGTTKVYTVVVTKSKENNANLQSLTINNGSLVPDFDKDTVEYTVDVENYVDSITLNGISESNKATVTGNGSYSLTEGENKLSITVTAEDGTIKTYKITVNRKENELAQTLLEDLSIIEGELIPEFNSETYNYIVNIPNEYDNVTINYVKHNEEATVEITGNDDLKVGHNIVTVKVSYNGESTEYIIDVIKQEKSNTYLKDLSVINQEIMPSFDKTIQSYSLDVENNVTEIEVQATAEVTANTIYIKSSDDYELYSGVTKIELNPGTNNIMVKVVSASNVERVYKIVVTRANSDENKLLTLTSNVGTISPEFDPNTKQYTIDVPIGSKYITLSGTVSENATVNGLGTYPLSVGTITKYITVTSQSGLVNTYEVNIVRKASSDATITNIVPSIGTLSPTFTTGISSYTVEVEGDVNQIYFDVTTSSTDSVVAGDGITELFAGKNIITLTSIAEDGITQESVNIEVYKKTDITSFDTDLEINVPIGNDYQIDIKYNPTNTDYKDMTYVSNDTSILTVSSTGIITPTSIGDTTITVTSSRNTSLTKTITVHVINPLIESDTYIINRDTEGYEYITGMEIGDTIEEFINNLKNEKENIVVYENTETDIVTEEETVKTKYVVKLTINNVIYDQLTLVVLGDVNGDGMSNVVDISLIKNYISNKSDLDTFEFAASNINVDDYVNVMDVSIIKNYISNKIDSLNTYLYEKEENN